MLQLFYISNICDFWVLFMQINFCQRSSHALYASLRVCAVFLNSVLAINWMMHMGGEWFYSHVSKCLALLIILLLCWHVHHLLSMQVQIFLCVQFCYLFSHPCTLTWKLWSIPVFRIILCWMYEDNINFFT